MFSIPFVFDRLLEMASMSLILFIPGSVAVLFCREPVRRMRIIVLTLAGGVAAPLVSLVPGMPHWSVPAELVALREAAEAPNERFEARDSVPQAPPAERRPIEASTGETVVEESAIAEHAIADRLPDAEADAEGASLDLASTTLEMPTTRDAPGDDTANADAHPVARTEHRPVDAPKPAGTFLTTDVRRLVVAIYAGGLALLFVWWLFGWAGLVRLLRNARPAPERCRALLGEIAGPRGDRVRLLVSRRAPQPFTFTWRVPVIVLPENLATGQEDGVRSSLAAVLAHEWSHVSRGDARIWSFAGFVRLVYFYQPLAWWLRAQLRLCQDYLADADAARMSSPNDYAEFLATRAVGRPLALGLGITAGKSDLFRRVAMLVRNRRSLERHCPRWWNTTAVLVAGALVVLAGTIGSRADTESPAAAFGQASSEGSAPAVSSPAEPSSKPATASPPITSESAPTIQVDREFAAKVQRFNELMDQKRFAEAAAVAKEARELKPGDPHIEVMAYKSKQALAQGTARSPADESVLRRPAESVEKKSAADADVQKLIEGLIARRQAFKSGRVTYTRGTSGPRELVFSGESWREKVPANRADDARANIPTERVGRVNHDGRLLILTESESAPRGPVRNRTFSLTVNPSARLHAGGLLACCSQDLLAFLTGHADQVQRVGRVVVLQVEVSFLGSPKGEYPMETEIIEVPYRVSLAALNRSSPQGDAARGTTRLWVAPRLGHALIRTQETDQFGLPWLITEFSEFEEVAPGLFAPHASVTRYSFRTDETRMTAVSDVNQPIPEREFVMRIPQGTQIEDRRPHRFDNEKEPRFDPKKYPLRRFTNWAEDLEGFPPAVLAEMDRDLVPAKEPDTIQGGKVVPKLFDEKADRGLAVPSSNSTGLSGRTAGVASAGPSGDSQIPAPTPKPVATTRKEAPPAATAIDKADLRYGGKSFAEWRQVLLRDLDPDSRIKALEALGTLGRNGYASEAASAVREVLKGDFNGTREEKVRSTALSQLEHFGTDGIAVLEQQLSNTAARSDAFIYLRNSLISSDAAVPAVLRALKEQKALYPGAAFEALITYQPQAAGVFEAWSSALSGDDAPNLRVPILSGLRQARGGLPEFPATLLLPLLGSEDVRVRLNAALVLAQHPAVDGDAAERFRKFILNDDSDVRSDFVRQLCNDGYRPGEDGRRLNPAVVVPLLVAILERSIDQESWDGAIALLPTMRLEGPSRAGVAALIGVAEAQPYQVRSPATRVAAVEALGKVSPPATEALPKLKRLRDNEPKGRAGVTVVRDWSGGIDRAIRDIERKGKAE